MSDSLLDDLAGKKGVFISDLKDRALFVDIITILCGVDVQRYRLDDWNDALSYILGTSFHFSNYQQVREFLVNYKPES